jgi:hypothetical protein
MELLKPRAVVASHKRPENDDKPEIIEETRQYIRDFDRLVETTKTAQELYDEMLKPYPNRVNRGWALWSSARAVKGSAPAAWRRAGRNRQDRLYRRRPENRDHAIGGILRLHSPRDEISSLQRWRRDRQQ